MGGPSASILLRERLSAGQLDQIESAIRAVSSHVETNTHYHCEFWVNDMRPLGGSYVEPGPPGRAGRPFGFIARMPEVYPDGWHLLEPDEVAAIRAAFGFEPQQQIQFDAMSKGPEINAILAGLVLHVVELCAGLVNFGGALLPRLPQEMYRDMWLWEKANWSDVEPYFTAMVKDMPGRIVGFPYETHNGRTWASHIADATFLRAWMAHPDFHMIK
jgi:hypothetical protein